MSLPDICISFLIAMIGLAYPLMLQVIARLEDKYQSINILNLIKNEVVWKLYDFAIKSSLVVVLIYIIINHPLLDFNDKVFHISIQIVAITLIVGTLLTVLFFLLFTKLVFVYYSPTNLIHYLISKDRKLYKIEEAYFNSISDILYQSIRQQNEPITNTISDYLYEAFQRCRDNQNDLEIEYPYSYYVLVNKTIEGLAILKDKRIPRLEYRTAGGIWLLGETKGHSIHESTYYWLWHNLLLAINYKRDDFVMHYWERAHHHITYNLSFIQPYYDYKTGKIRNEDAITKRNKERERFLEFHYALGGLLLYSNRYELISRIFRFTTSLPPVYELFPNHMNEVFKQYFRFRDPFDDDYMRIRQRYYFPNLEGINSEYVIKNWICKYMTLLFLRQYTIVPYLIIMKPLEYPTIPEPQSEKKMWLDNLGHFKALVAEHLENLQLIKSLGFEFLIDGRIEETDNPSPMVFMEELMRMVEQDYKQTESEQPVSREKGEAFLSFTNQHLIPVFESISSLSNDKLNADEYKDWYITGENAVIDKSSFAENQPSENLNYHSFLAESLADKCYRGMSEIFYTQTRKRYLFKKEDFFKALDNLKLSPDKHIIVAFGINLHDYDAFAHINGLTDSDYNGIPILRFAKCSYDLAGHTLFILNKDNLPLIEFLETDEKNKDKYLLVEINKAYKLYAQVVDLFRNNDLRNELTQSRPSEDLTKSVLMNISFVIRFRWAKKANMISLRLHSKYHERGLPNNPSEIEPLD